MRYYYNEGKMVTVQEYQDLAGKNEYRDWFNELDVAAAVKVTTAVERIAQGNTSSFKPVGEGVSEYRLDWGPGYRIYLGQDGDTLLILLGGGTKKGQNTDIENAQAAWREYKQRKAAARKAAAKATPKEKSNTQKRRK
jgi:putative addiction module killer protein